MKLAYLTHNRPETLARLPQDIPHVIVWAEADGTYSPEMLAQVADVDAMVVSAEPVTAQLLDAAPKLKLVQRLGVGYNTLDLAAARERGVPCCNVAGVNKESVAEHALSMLLALAKNLPAADALTREADWAGARLLTRRSVELYGKTIGIIGLGDTGSTLARRARGLEMRVLYNDIREIDPATVRELDATFAEKDALFAEADVVSVMTDLNEQSAGMVTAERIGMMKPGSYFLCCARGGIVDEAALARALQEERLAGAGIDVFATEPIEDDNPLLQAPNCLLTSHVAGLAPESRDRNFEWAFDNIRRVLERGEKPRWVVNGVE